jgi:ATP-dependent helicase/nuclease subunit B
MPPDPRPLDTETLYLTVNKRLATALRRIHDEAQTEKGLTVWPTPDVLPWSSWLQRSYVELIDQGRAVRELISPHQELALWERVIREHGGSTLVNPAAAARLATEAFTLCADWSLDVAELGAIGGQDTRFFAGWHGAFMRELEQRGLLVHALLPLRLRSAFEDAELAPPPRLCLAGFDRPTPVQQQLLDSLAQRGSHIDWHAPRVTRAECCAVRARDGEHETHAAAAWVADRLRDNPQARLAVIVPALATRRRSLHRIFSQTLAPARYLGASDAPVPFNISLGEPLAGQPLIAHALTACRLAVDALSVNEIGLLLRSPFIGGHTQEWEPRALFDSTLRATRRPTFGLSDLIHRAGRLDSEDSAACPDLLTRLRGLAALDVASGPPREAARWTGVLRDLLKAWGWPGAHSLDSAEYQQYQRFLELLDELGGLDKVRGPLSFREALAQLSRLATDTVFQPQSGPVPVQIIGPLEAAGLTFDGIWLLGLDDQHWPAPAQPHPLLPAGVQRELAMPHASAERELAFATTLLERFASSAPLLMASYPEQLEDQPATPSPLIIDWPRIDAAQHFGEAVSPLWLACSDAGERRPMPPPTAVAAPSALQGGAGLLAAQASCPFAAVAHYRLHAESLEEPVFAPDGAMVGSLVHRLLQRIWHSLEDSAGLSRRSADELEALVGAHARQVLDDAAAVRPDLFGMRFRALEAERLTRLMLAWLDAERQREQGFEVVALERDQTAQLGTLTLTTRADRIDRLSDGTLAVIDYKTGREISDRGWFEDRLIEPQLPLYTTTAGAHVGTALLARVRSDGPGCRFVGVSREPGFAPGVTTPAERQEGLDWDELQQHWRSSLEELAAEFIAGRSDPTPSILACTYCEFAGLCRVAERQQGPDDE